MKEANSYTRIFVTLSSIKIDIRKIEILNKLAWADPQITNQRAFWRFGVWAPLSEAYTPQTHLTEVLL